MQSASNPSAWIRQIEHFALRLVSFVLSAVSAHAIFWFFAWLDWIDPWQGTFTWVTTLGFGALGYIVSRGLASRLMSGEKEKRIGIYLGISCVFELVEVVCNSAQAMITVPRIAWLHMVSPAMSPDLSFIAFVVLSIIPLVTIWLAWVDMDLGGAKNATPHWLREIEHGTLRVTAFLFSVVSAHAIYWFFAGLNQVDSIQVLFTVLTALGFGLLGYVVSRGLAHRLLSREHVGPYIGLGIIFELVEVFCNFLQAAVVIPRLPWLAQVPANFVGIYTVAAYLVLSIIPLSTILLAWVDMDLEIAKRK
jgi:hypothetical protein